MAVSAAGSPDNTVEVGPLLTAIDTRSSEPTSTRRASSMESSTTAMAPCPTVRLNNRLRWQMTRTASSRLSAPATYAAATSPKLWPTTACGSIPHERHRAARATSIAKRAGWMMSISFNRDWAASVAVSSVSNDQSPYGRIARSQRSTTSRKTGSCSNSRRPMPNHWLPCPGNTKTSFRWREESLRPDDKPGRVSPRKKASRLSISCAGESPVTARR